MKNGLLLNSKKVDSNENISSQKMQKKLTCYELMHGNKKVAEINTRGEAAILEEKFFPYDLYLEEERDFDTLINNMNNFYHWCASRVLSLDRKYAKEILNSIGMAQATTDLDRAKISLSYHCVSLTDIYWVREKNEAVSFDSLNLYDHSLNEALVALPLRGKSMTVTNQELAPDLSTKGCFPKAWIRRENDFILLKDGGDDAVKRELIASRVCQCFDFPQVVYKEGFYDGERVTESRIITSKQYSIISKMAFEIYALNHDLNVLEECIRVDEKTYYGMNILDYLVGNIDRHPENWGFLVDNQTNEYVSLYPIMDFNQSFGSYDTLEGAPCQTVYPERKTQREAAIEAVHRIGLHQVKEVDGSIFEDMTEWKDMFFRRLEELKHISSAGMNI
ncbi:hypothetical protein ABXS75_17140 [Roseburia hominis]